LKDHQAAQTATVASSSNGNPFDEPLASEKAEAAHKAAMPNSYEKATAAGPYAPAGAAEKAMGEQFGDNRAQAKQALNSTLSSAGYTAGGILGAGGVGEAADPIVSAVVSHLGKVKTILDAASKLSLTGMGIREARELYKEFAADKK
jgi:hypothetical protein